MRGPRRYDDRKASDARDAPGYRLFPPLAALIEGLNDGALSNLFCGSCRRLDCGLIVGGSCSGMRRTV